MRLRRLDKYLKDATTLRRRDVKESIWEGKVLISIGGEEPVVVQAPQTLIFPEDAVYFRDERLTIRTPSSYTMFHKPPHFLTASRDPYGRPHLSGWLAQLPPGVSPVGRLDRMTTGLLLLIDDGDLSQSLTSPKHHVIKTYLLTIEGEITLQDPRFTHLCGEVILDDGPSQARSVELLSSSKTESLIALSLDEGRNRQVRRMCGAVRMKLKHLHRDKLGPLSLGDLQEGAMRSLSAEEVEALWFASGGKQRSQEGAQRALLKQAARCREKGAPHLRLERWIEEHISR